MFYKDSDISWHINYALSQGKSITEDDAKAMIDFYDECQRLNNDRDSIDNENDTDDDDDVDE